MHEIMIMLPPEIVRQIEALARRQDRSRANQLRQLVRLGLEQALREEAARAERDRHPQAAAAPLGAVAHPQAEGVPDP